MNWLSILLKDMGHEPPVVPWENLVADASARDGFVRERAVIAIAKTGSDAALPILLARANDWVVQVRQAAYAGVGLYLTGQYIQAWAMALDELVALDRAGRTDHSPLLERIKSFLSTPENLCVLKESSRPRTADVARWLFAFELAIPLSDEARFQQLREAILGADIVVASAALSAMSMLSPDRRASLASEACASAFSSVRAAGLRAVLTGASPASESLIRTMCRDASPNVRALAIAELKDDREGLSEELRTAYRTAGSAKQRAVALDVLCSLGVDDADLLCRTASADRASQVRAVAATRRFGLVDGMACDQLVLETLSDRSPRVRRIALARIRKGAQPPNAQALLQLVEANPAAFDLLARVATYLSPWDRVEFLLSATAHFVADRTFLDGASRELRMWCADMSRCFVQPSLQQSSNILRHWAAVRDGLTLDLQRRLANHLRDFRVLA
ncbi:hypothetical protein [Hydrogenophaga sp.]|uniref:hypothetical protein n=1 Tax=Hydrogenophaga sp. TaxID=1904254 RepID=UPI0027283E22|nr:hypothetical protein [Hydrogenophaga sp.]MDO9437625.1 hypothetical protein [Hydrogenophaga sp.]